MRKSIWIDKKEETTLMLGHHALIHFFNHHVIKANLSDILSSLQKADIQKVTFKKITLDNISDCSAGEFSVWRMEQYLLEQPEKVIGFLMYETSSMEPIGYIWAMFKGGDEVQYKIRTIDAYGFDVCVMSKFRGKGYCGLLLRKIAEHLSSEKGFQEMVMVVRTNNTSALRAYEKVGFKIIAQKTYIRLLGQRYGVNVPYYKL